MPNQKIGLNEEDVESQICKAIKASYKAAQRKSVSSNGLEMELI